MQEDKEIKNITKIIIHEFLEILSKYSQAFKY